MNITIKGENSTILTFTVLPKVNWSWMDIWSIKGVQITGPSWQHQVYRTFTYSTEEIFIFLLVILSSNE